MPTANLLLRITSAAIVAMLAMATRASAEDRPYFVTYDHHLSEAGELEVNFTSKLGFPKKTGRFASATMELEYGANRWWTAEFRLAGQHIQREGAEFTGFEWENRIRPLRGEHLFNPVFSFEFENVSGNDKTVRDITGRNKSEWNEELSGEREREIETKLILSSDIKGWNFSENFIATKNLDNEPWEFGYSAGAGRILMHRTAQKECSFCVKSLRAGVEVYGGLGNWHFFGFSDTAHYIAPALACELQNGLVLRVSPSFGLTGGSYPFLLGFGISLEYPSLASRIRHLLRQAAPHSPAHVKSDQEEM